MGHRTSTHELEETVVPSRMRVKRVEALRSRGACLLGSHLEAVEVHAPRATEDAIVVEEEG